MAELDLYQAWQTKADKFHYGLITVTFAATALSLQYSPSFGDTWPYCLILSWCFYLISIGFGGGRALYDVTHTQINFNSIETKKLIRAQQSVINHPGFELSIASGAVIEPNTGEKWTKAQLLSNFALQKERLKIYEEGMEKISKRVPNFFRIQFVAFILGITLNVTFVSVNYLSKIYSISF